MLVLTRRAGESFRIGESTVTITRVGSDGRIRVGIDAPVNVPIVRDDARLTEPRQRHGAA